ncbi:MAG: cell filamentation protein Fic, partial [Burkholderiales bacterium]|nr:cell filamentation protein Fic [Burkholderiales bacterium]
MEQQLKDPLGAAWLSATYGISLMARLPVLSQIGGRRTTHWDGSFRKEIYPEAMRPTSDLVGHLQFHLRHEIPNLEFLARLFAVTGGDDIQGWINAEPTGQYARRAAFLFEWITGSVLAVPQKLGGNYTDVIDDALVVAASQSKVQKVQRWRVNNNLPGTPLFCPLVLKTGPVNQAVQLDVAELFGQLTNEFGEDLLLRAATWMTLRESKAS